MHPLLQLKPVVIASLPAALFGLVFVSPGRAQANPSPTRDAASLVRRAVANHFAAEEKQPRQRFVLHKKDDRHDYIQIVVETRQGDVAMAIAANGAPLSAAMHQAQLDRLQNLDEHPELQEHRRKREAEDTARANKLLRMLPDAFLYRYDTTVPCVVTPPQTGAVPGLAEVTNDIAQPSPVTHDCYRLTFRPNPRWDPPDTEAKILRGLAGSVLIDQAAERLTRLNARLTGDVDFGWGIIGHLDKGGTIYLEQSLVAPDDWELTRMKLNLTGRALMVKALSYHITEDMTRYAPVPADLDYHQAIQLLKAEPVAAPQ